MSDITKLETRRADLRAELDELTAQVTEQTAAMGAQMLEGKDTAKGLDALSKAAARSEILRAAIAQADSRLRELRQAEAERERAAAIDRAQALDAEGRAAVINFVYGILQAEAAAAAFDALYKRQKAELQNVNAAPRLEMDTLRVWLDFNQGRAWRAMLIRRFGESRPDLLRQARELFG